jgi:hypothetical protein
MFLEQGQSVKASGVAVTTAVLDYIYAQDLPLIPQTDGRVSLIGGAVKRIGTVAPQALPPLPGGRWG